LEDVLLGLVLGSSSLPQAASPRVENTIHAQVVAPALGLAYKKNVGDTRESPAFQVLKRLIELGADVSYHDPHVPTAPETRSWPEHPELRSQPLTADTLRAHHAVVLVTDHDGVDYPLVLEHARLIVDSRGVYRQAHPKVVKA
jgi:UDP-N-acetyl-D-glucosamine dehydrogenase